MTYNAGTATDYIDLLDQLIEVVTGRHMATVAVNAGGTLHAVGDIIDITATGSTSTEVAKIEVVTLSGSAIATARIYRGGVYTVDPTTIVGNAQSATTGVGTGATFDITFAATGWTLNTRRSEAVVAAATVAAGGTGYAVSDVLTLIGGVLSKGGAAATYTVATLSGSAVATVTQTTQGDYEVVPANAVLTSVAPSGGTGCTLTVAWQDLAGDTRVVLTGDAGAAIDPVVGIVTYSNETDETSINTVYNWALFGMTSWSSALALHQQPNISDGFDITVPDGDLTGSTSGDGAFVPLKPSDAFSIDWWIRANGRNVTMVARIEAAATNYYAFASFGLLNQFGITTEFPYPAFIAGTSDRKRVWYRDTGSIFGGPTEVIRRNNGPQFVWAPEGTWHESKNASISSNTSTTPGYSTENTTPRVNTWPLGPSNTHDTADDQTWAIAGSLGFDNDDFTLGVNPIAIYRTPDTGGDLFPLFPNTILQADSASDFFRTFGEMDGVWWFHIADATITSEDRITQGGAAYTIFQNGTRIQDWSYFALRED
tara:strand:- start:7579 stop:9201 length:1623 start_codon:yes stop_codon:yes gene_type:complete